MNRVQLQSLRIHNLMSRRRARVIVRWLWGLHELPPGLLLAMAVGLTVASGYAGYIIAIGGARVLFFLLPIGLAAWGGGLRGGAIIAILAVLVNSSVVYGLGWQDVLVGRGALDTSLSVLAFMVFAYLVSVVSRILMYEQGVSHTDPLTGLANRRLLSEYFRAEVRRARRYNRPISVVYMDIDNFKSINDNFGHSAGDSALRMLAKIMVENSREMDTTARMGGDEFVLVLPETTHDGVSNMLSRIRSKFIEAAGRRGWEVGLSMGAAVYMRPPENINLILSRVDRLLVAVKRGGKNATQMVTMGWAGCGKRDESAENTQGEALQGAPRRLVGIH